MACCVFIYFLFYSSLLFCLSLMGSIILLFLFAVRAPAEVHLNVNSIDPSALWTIHRHSILCLAIPFTRSASWRMCACLCLFAFPSACRLLNAFSSPFWIAWVCFSIHFELHIWNRLCESTVNQDLVCFYSQQKQINRKNRPKLPLSQATTKKMPMKMKNQQRNAKTINLANESAERLKKTAQHQICKYTQIRYRIVCSFHFFLYHSHCLPFTHFNF